MVVECSVLKWYFNTRHLCLVIKGWVHLITPLNCQDFGCPVCNFTMSLIFVQELMRKGVMQPADIGNLSQTLKSGYLGHIGNGESQSACNALLDLVNCQFSYLQWESEI